ncbi:hypothetical protein CLF_113073, partial [Clonorchis sinensis]
PDLIAVRERRATVIDVSIVSDGRGVTVWNEKKQKHGADEFSLAISSALRAIGCDVDFLDHQPMIISYRGICFPQPAKPVIGLGHSKVTVSDLCLLAIVGFSAGVESEPNSTFRNSKSPNLRGFIVPYREPQRQGAAFATKSSWTIEKYSANHRMTHVVKSTVWGKAGGIQRHCSLGHVCLHPTDFLILNVDTRDFLTVLNLGLDVNYKAHPDRLNGVACRVLRETILLPHHSSSSKDLGVWKCRYASGFGGSMRALMYAQQVRKSKTQYGYPGNLKVIRADPNTTIAEQIEGTGNQRTDVRFAFLFECEKPDQFRKSMESKTKLGRLMFQLLRDSRCRNTSYRRNTLPIGLLKIRRQPTTGFALPIRAHQQRIQLPGCITNERSSWVPATEIEHRIREPEVANYPLNYKQDIPTGIVPVEDRWLRVIGVFLSGEQGASSDKSGAFPQCSTVAASCSNDTILNSLHCESHRSSMMFVTEVVSTVEILLKSEFGTVQKAPAMRSRINSEIVMPYSLHLRVGPITCSQVGQTTEPSDSGSVPKENPTVRCVAGTRRSARSMPIHYLRRTIIAQQYRSELAQQLSTVKQYYTGSEHVDEAWQNVKGAILAAFTAVCPTSPIRPQDHWMSSRLLSTIDARKAIPARQRVRRRAQIPQMLKSEESKTESSSGHRKLGRWRRLCYGKQPRLISTDTIDWP